MTPLLGLLPFFEGSVWLIATYVVVANLHSVVSQYLCAVGRTKLFAGQGILNTVLVIGLNVLFLPVLDLGVTGYVGSIVLADLLTRLTKPLPEEIAGAISMIILGIGLAASGVILAVKRREIAADLSGEWMDRRVRKCFLTCGRVIVLMVMMFVNILLFLP